MSRNREAVTGTPLTAPELAITVSAPASTAALYDGRIVSWRYRIDMSAGARSWPLNGSEYPAKCLVVAAIGRPLEPS